MSDDSVDIRALAKLARLEISDEEVVTLGREIPSILSFVETIQKVSSDTPHNDAALRNVMRDDDHPDETGLYTDALLSVAPVQKENKIVVKQVISRKK